jgi:hypothetical protein
MDSESEREVGLYMCVIERASRERRERELLFERSDDFYERESASKGRHDREVLFDGLDGPEKVCESLRDIFHSDVVFRNVLLLIYGTGHIVQCTHRLDDSVLTQRAVALKSLGLLIKRRNSDCLYG